MISSSENRVSYDGDGLAKEFAYQFKILEKNDIKVMLVKPDGSTQILSKDYYVDAEKSVVIYPGYAPGAEIPESERPPILPTGWRLVLYREVPITQLVHLPEIWPFNVIEAMADKLTIICQQLFGNVKRCLKIGNEVNTDEVDVVIPLNKDEFIKVNQDGTGFETEPYDRLRQDATAAVNETVKQDVKDYIEAHPEYVTTVMPESIDEPKLAPALAKKKASWYQSVAEMKADPLLKAGMTACTLGYYSPNDGGAGTYIIRAKADGDVDDGGSLHELANGCVAELVVENGTVNVKQFGAKGDGVTDDSIAFKSSIAISNVLLIPIGRYLIKSPITINKDMHIQSAPDVYISFTEGAYISLHTYTKIKNVTFLSDGNLFKGDIRYVTLSNCKFNGIKIVFDCKGHQWYGVLNIYNCFFENCTLFDADEQINIVAFYGGYINHSIIINTSSALNLENWTFNSVDIEYTSFYTGNNDIRLRQLVFNECYLEHDVIFDTTGNILNRTVIIFRNCWMYIDEKMINIVTSNVTSQSDGSAIFDNCCIQILDETILPIVSMNFARYKLKYSCTADSTFVNGQILEDLTKLFKVKCTPVIEVLDNYTNKISDINLNKLTLGANALQQENVLTFNNSWKLHTVVNGKETPMLQCYPIASYNDLNNLPAALPVVCLLYLQVTNEMFLKTSFSGTQVYKLNMTLRT